MAQLIRPLRQWPWPWLHHRYCATIPLHYHLLNSTQPSKPTYHRFASAHRNLHSKPRRLRITNVPLPTELDNGSDTVSDPEPKKSRNQQKREARRAVLWGMELASFSVPQIKRILRVASLDQVVFEALMVVKKLGPDVREGKRRQFNYIGKLLREVQPELMDRLIKATKDADHKELQALSVLGPDNPEDDDDLIETESMEDEEHNQVDALTDNQVDALTVVPACTFRAIVERERDGIWVEDGKRAFNIEGIALKISAC